MNWFSCNILHMCHTTLVLGVMVAYNTILPAPIIAWMIFSFLMWHENLIAYHNGR